MKPSSTSSFRRAEVSWATAAALLGALLLPACVTRGTHREVVAARDRNAGDLKLARNRLEFLEASNESLSGERADLIGEVETLRQEQLALQESKAELEAAVGALEAARSALEADRERQRLALEARVRDVDELRATYDGLVQDLQTEVSDGRIQIERLRDGIQVKLSQAILFPSGSVAVGPEGLAVLNKVAARLAAIPHPIEVSGHTDAVPIRGALAERYPSNWELAGARAAQVVRILAAGGVSRSQLSAVSRADNEPVAPNDNEQGKARNRRIEIRLRPSRAEAPAGAVAPAGPTGTGVSQGDAP